MIKRQKRCIRAKDIKREIKKGKNEQQEEEKMFSATAHTRMLEIDSFRSVAQRIDQSQYLIELHELLQ